MRMRRILPCQYKRRKKFTNPVTSVKSKTGLGYLYTGGFPVDTTEYSYRIVNIFYVCLRHVDKESAWSKIPEYLAEGLMATAITLVV